MWIYGCLIFKVALISAEVLTFINNETVTCVLTDESVYSALYIWPLCKETIKRPIKVFDQWCNNDWTRENRRQRKIPLPVTDIRFEGYESYDDYWFESISTPIYFSTDLLSDTYIYLTHTDLLFYSFTLNLREPKICHWRHLHRFGNYLVQYANLKNAIVDFVQTWNETSLIFTGRYYARNISYSITSTPKENKGSYIDLSNISNSTDLCISMFVAMDENSILEITLESGNKTIRKKISASTVSKLLNLHFLYWKRIEIKTNSYNGTGRLYLRRRTKLYEGFWAVDYIHQCRHSIEVYRRSSNGSFDYICGTLDKKDFMSSTFCNKTGYVGKYCNISCEAVLGKPYASCNNHKICHEDGQCQCASGYQGPICEEKLSFHNENEERLSDKTSCPNGHVVTAIAIILGALVLGLIYYFYLKCNKRRRQQLPLEDQFEIGQETLLNENKHNTKINVNNIENCLKNIFLDNNYLAEQFNTIPNRKNYPCTIALQNKNSNRNKDGENIPYDYSRVVLEKLPGLDSKDYINASFLNGYNRPKVYIVSQGPKFYTVSDFWRMIWQEDIETIVMATNFVENDNRMCIEYWNQGLNTIFECGELTVRMIDEKIYEHYDSRIFELHYTRYRREIHHFHLKWNSESQKSLYPCDIVPVLKHIRDASENNNKPILIHSSSGSNRSGTLILCDLALQMAQSEGYVDFYELLKTMRNERPNMINKKEYYMLAHLIVLEYLLDRENPFRNLLDDNFNPAVIQQQINYLEKLAWQDSVINSWNPENKSDSALAPTFVDGYAQSRKFVITNQLLTEKFANNFWHLIADEEIKCVLFLNKPNNNLWPYRIESAATVIKVMQRELESTSSYTMTKLSLLVFDSITNEIIKDNEVWIFQLHHWKPTRAIPDSPHDIVESVVSVMKISLDQKRILVANSNKTGAIGLVLALFYVLEKYKKECEVDVCYGIRLVKRSGLNFSPNSKELNFIYTAVKYYLQNIDKYVPMEI